MNPATADKQNNTKSLRGSQVIERKLSIQEDAEPSEDGEEAKFLRRNTEGEVKAELDHGSHMINYLYICPRFITSTPLSHAEFKYLSGPGSLVVFPLVIGL